MKKTKAKSLVASSLSAAMMLSLSGMPMMALANEKEPIKPELNDKKEVKQETMSEGRRLVGYFPEWAYKSAEHNYFDVADLQWDSLTDIQYSFAEIDPATNKIKLMDEHAALEEDFSDRELTHKGEVIELDPTLPYKGHFNVIQQMKKMYPDVKVTMSVGGWAASRGFYTMLDTDEGIDTFVQSCVDFLREYNFDGIDIDFEFPSSTSQSGNPDDFDLSEPRRKTINARYNVFMKKLNAALDKAGEEDGKHYVTSAAVSASSWVLGGVEDNSYAKELDFLSMMTYDFHGGWNEFVENQANIYGDPADNETSGMLMPVLSADWAFKYYRGVLPSEKILMGIPYYTRGWENVQGGNGTGLHGKSSTPATGKYNLWGDPDPNRPGELIPAGANPLWHVLNLMDQDPNLQLHWDDVGKVPYVWQNNEKVFLSFENEQSIDERLKFIEENNLGGALIWVMDGDYGLNPNYVPGSTDVNEGKYTFGDTLTKKLSDGFKEMGPAKITTDETPGLAPIAVEVEQTGTYDHPNYTYDFNITNHTDKAIPGGWEISFDLPKSAEFKSTWGGSFTSEDNGDFNRITLKSSGWQTLEPGASTNLQGMIGLCFSGIQNVTFNGMKPVGNADVETPEENAAPVFAGVTNKTINAGDSFDKLAGITATDKEDGNLTSKIKVTGNVDTTKAGTYKLTYSVIDSEGIETTATRTITVVAKEEVENSAPVFSGVEELTLNVGDKFAPKKGVTANDAEDGDLTSSIKVVGAGKVDTTKPGTYKVTYKVADSEGLETKIVRNVVVIEAQNSAPVFKGAEDKTLKVGEKFAPRAGVKATDKEDGNLTPSMIIEGKVNTNKAGKYILKYRVTDSEGLETIVNRTITVVSEEESKNTAPVINGAVDRTITVGDSVNLLDGVTAIDEEDGNLTSKIVIEGAVDATKANKYTVTYKVKDSKGLETVKTITVTVKEEATSPEVGEDTFDVSKVYLEGDTVIYKGVKYTAKWWVQGEYPDESAAWDKELIYNSDGSVDYYDGMVCTQGTIVSYQGKLYEAKWWTTSTPGSDDSWQSL